jgi:hypothetical protein
VRERADPQTWNGMLAYLGHKGRQMFGSKALAADDGRDMHIDPKGAAGGQGGAALDLFPCKSRRDEGRPQFMRPRPWMRLLLRSS